MGWFQRIFGTGSPARSDSYSAPSAFIFPLIGDDDQFDDDEDQNGGAGDGSAEESGAEKRSDEKGSDE